MIYLRGELICYTMSCMPTENCEWSDYKDGYSIMMVYKDPNAATTEAYIATTQPETTTQATTTPSPVYVPENTAHYYNPPSIVESPYTKQEQDYQEGKTEQTGTLPEDTYTETHLGDQDTSDQMLIHHDSLENNIDEDEQKKEELENAIKQQEEVEEEERKQTIDIWSHEGTSPVHTAYNPWEGTVIKDNTKEDQKPPQSVDNNETESIFMTNLKQTFSEKKMLILIVVLSALVLITIAILVGLKFSQKRKGSDYRKYDNIDDASSPLYSLDDEEA